VIFRGGERLVQKDNEGKRSQSPVKVRWH